MEDVEYRPQSSLGTSTLAKAYFAVAVMGRIAVARYSDPRRVYMAAFPFAAGNGWFSRLRRQATAPHPANRHRDRESPLRTRLIPWAQIRDVKVVNRVTVARVAVVGNRSPAAMSSRSGGGARKLSSVRVQHPNGRSRELAMPVAWENAPDPEFTNKAGSSGTWRAAVGRVSALRPRALRGSGEFPQRLHQLLGELAGGAAAA